MNKIKELWDKIDFDFDFVVVGDRYRSRITAIAIGVGLGLLLLAFTIGFLFLFLFALPPMIFLWSINSLAEAGGAAFYIPHELWTYFVSYVLISLLLVISK